MNVFRTVGYSPKSADAVMPISGLAVGDVFDMGVIDWQVIVIVTSTVKETVGEHVLYTITGVEVVGDSVYTRSFDSSCMIVMVPDMPITEYTTREESQYAEAADAPSAYLTDESLDELAAAIEAECSHDVTTTAGYCDSCGEEVAIDSETGKRYVPGKAKEDAVLAEMKRETVTVCSDCLPGAVARTTDPQIARALMYNEIAMCDCGLTAYFEVSKS